jgi:hypothetical protein
MGPESILLSVKQNGREGSYRFTCPNCADAVEKRADRKIVALLVSAGVDVSDAVQRVQAELDFHYGSGLSEPDEAEDAMDQSRPMDPADSITGDGLEPPPFTIDDVIRMHFLLQDDGFLRQLATEQ